MRSKAFFGIEIGGTKIQIVAGSDELKIGDRRRFTVEPARGAAGILDQISAGANELLRQFQPVRGAIGFGGPVDWRTGQTCCSHQVEGWADFQLGKWAEQLLDAPVVVDNDANIAALGEALQGAGAGKNPVFYVTLGSGVGGGLVVDRSIYHGAIPGESEIGHLRLERNGIRLEQRCSGWAVDKKIRSLARDHPESILIRMIGQEVGGEAKYLRKALDQTDALAERVLAELCGDLAFGLSHVTHLVHPQVIILGGGLSFVGEPLRAGVASNLDRFTMDAFRPRPEIRLAALGEDVVPIGCLVAARQRLNNAAALR